MLSLAQLQKIMQEWSGRIGLVWLLLEMSLKPATGISLLLLIYQVNLCKFSLELKVIVNKNFESKTCITLYRWGHWPRTMAPISQFYLTLAKQTTSLLNCTSFFIENHLKIKIVTKFQVKECNLTRRTRAKIFPL